MDIFARNKMEYRPIEVFKEYENNPRLNRAAIPKVKASIENFGFLVPVVVDKDNVIVCGHTRVRAAKELGFKELPCIAAEDLTPEQVDAFRVADNKVAEFAGWDFAKLEIELENLKTSFDMEDFGFQLEDLDFSFETPVPEETDEIPSGGDRLEMDEVDDFYEEPDYEMPGEFPETMGDLMSKGEIMEVGSHRVFCTDPDDSRMLDRALEGVSKDSVILFLPLTGDRVTAVARFLSDHPEYRIRVLDPNPLVCRDIVDAMVENEGCKAEKIL